MKTEDFLILLTGEIEPAIEMADKISMNGVRCASNGADMALIAITSTATAGEIKDFLGERGRNVVVTEMGNGGAAYFERSDIAITLFGDKADNYTGPTVGDIIDELTMEDEPDENEPELDYSQLSARESMEEIDRLIGDGKNMTDETRELVGRLSENI